MKKSIKILFIVTLFIILLSNTKIYAADKAAKVTLTPNKTKLNIGDTVSIDIKLSNITVTNGISYVLGRLEYSQDIFEVVYEDINNIDNIDLDELANEYELEEIKVASYDEDGWCLLLRRSR